MSMNPETPETIEIVLHVDGIETHLEMIPATDPRDPAELVSLRRPGHPDTDWELVQGVIARVAVSLGLVLTPEALEAAEDDILSEYLTAADPVLTF